MADRRVRVIFEAQIANFKRGMSELAKDTEELKKKATESGKATDKQVSAIKTLAPAITIAGGAMTLAGAKIVQTFADFDKAMSSVQAATHETEENMASLRQAAIDAGADTAFSAQEAAGAIEELAKAGVSTEQILGGGLAGALDLAAAGNLAVSKSAEIAASAMTQFKLEGDQIPHLADLLAAGAGKAQGSVEDLGGALNQSGLVASSTGLTIEETTGALAAFASAGLTGSDAGTSFKTMLQSLTPNSDKAATIMEELGLSAYDAQGEFIGMSEYAGQLQTALADMSSEQRNATLKTLFGSDAVRAATVLYEQGADGIQKWEDAVNDAGYAAETAAVMQDNLRGDIEKLGGAFDTVFIQSGSGANDSLRLLVQTAESFVDLVGQIPAPILSTVAVVAGLTGGAALLAGGLINAIPKIKETRDAIRDLAPTGSRGERALRGLGRGAEFAAKGIGALGIVGPGVGMLVSSGLKADPTKLADELFRIGAGGDAAKGGIANLDGMFTAAKSLGSGLDVDGLQSAFQVIGNPSTSQNVDQVVSSILTLGTRGSSNMEFVTKNFAELDTQLTSMASNGATEQAAKSYEHIRASAIAAGVPAEKLAEIFPRYTGTLASSSVAAKAAADGSDTMTEALEGTGVAANGVVEAMDEFLELLFATGMITMDSRDAQFTYQESLRGVKDVMKEITDSGGKMGAILDKSGSDFNKSTEAGKLANDTFQGLARDGMAQVQAMAEEGIGQDQLQEKLNGTYNDLVKVGEGFGLSTKDAQALAREILGVPKGVSVKSWMSDNARKEAEKAKKAVDILNGSSATVYTHYKTTGDKAGPLKINPRDVLMNSFVPAKAGGGDLDMAPGPKGVDSQLFIGAKGEHVLTAGEVDLMGGQDAVYSFRAALRAGIPSHRNGGELGVPSTALMATNQVARGDSGNGGLDLSGSTFTAFDPAALRRDITNDVLWTIEKNTGARFGDG